MNRPDSLKFLFLVLVFAVSGDVVKAQNNGWNNRLCTTKTSFDDLFPGFPNEFKFSADADEKSGKPTKTWVTGSTLLIGFLDGNEGEHQDVKKYATLWIRGDVRANLEFNFDILENIKRENKKPDILITFKGKPGEFNSLVGISSREKAGRFMPSMVLSNLGSLKNEADKKGLILHEFGHALGLLHEHQNPNAKLNLDEGKVLEYYKSQFGWDKDKVEANILKPFNRNETIFSAFDMDSVMLYSFPAELTKDNKGLPDNTELSGKDREGISLLYPPDNSNKKWYTDLLEKCDPVIDLSSENIYCIKCVKTKTVFDVDIGSRKLQAYSDERVSNQIFKFEKITGNIYKILATDRQINGLVIDGDEGNIYKSGCRSTIQPYRGVGEQSLHQEWEVWKRKGIGNQSRVIISNRKSKLVIDFADSGNAIQLAEFHDPSDYQNLDLVNPADFSNKNWYTDLKTKCDAEHNLNGTFKIVCLKNGLAIDADIGSHKIQQYLNNGVPNQEWVFEKVEGNTYKIKSNDVRALNKVIDADEGKVFTPGGRMTIQPFRGVNAQSDHQLWEIWKRKEGEDLGSYVIVNKKSKLVLDFADNNQVVQLARFHGGKFQLFNLNPKR